MTDVWDYAGDTALMDVWDYAGDTALMDVWDYAGDTALMDVWDAVGVNALMDGQTHSRRLYYLMDGHSAAGAMPGRIVYASLPSMPLCLYHTHRTPQDAPETAPQRTLCHTPSKPSRCPDSAVKPTLPDRTGTAHILYHAIAYTIPTDGTKTA